MCYMDICFLHRCIASSLVRRSISNGRTPFFYWCLAISGATVSSLCWTNLPAPPPALRAARHFRSRGTFCNGWDATLDSLRVLAGGGDRQRAACPHPPSPFPRTCAQKHYPHRLATTPNARRRRGVWRCNRTLPFHICMRYLPPPELLSSAWATSAALLFCANISHHHIVEQHRTPLHSLHICDDGDCEREDDEPWTTSDGDRFSDFLKGAHATNGVSSSKTFGNSVNAP